MAEREAQDEQARRPPLSLRWIRAYLQNRPPDVRRAAEDQLLQLELLLHQANFDTLSPTAPVPIADLQAFKPFAYRLGHGAVDYWLDRYNATPEVDATLANDEVVYVSGIRKTAKHELRPRDELSPFGQYVFDVLVAAYQGRPLEPNLENPLEFHLSKVLSPVIAWVGDVERDPGARHNMVLRVANLATREEQYQASLVPLPEPGGARPWNQVVADYLSQVGRRELPHNGSITRMREQDSDVNALAATTLGLRHALNTEAPRLSAVNKALSDADAFDRAAWRLTAGFEKYFELTSLLRGRDRLCEQLRARYRALPDNIGDLTLQLATADHLVPVRAWLSSYFHNREKPNLQNGRRFGSIEQRMVDPSFLSFSEDATFHDPRPEQIEVFQALVDGAMKYQACWGLVAMGGGKSNIAWMLADYFSREGHEVICVGGVQTSQRDELEWTFMRQSTPENKLNFYVPDNAAEMKERYGTPGLVHLVTSQMVHSVASQVKRQHRDKPLIVICDELHTLPSEIRGESLIGLGGIMLGLTGQEARPNGQELEELCGPRVAEYPAWKSIDQGRTLDVEIRVPSDSGDVEAANKRMTRIDLPSLVDEVILLIDEDDARRTRLEANQKGIIVGSVDDAIYVHKRLCEAFGEDRLYLRTYDPRHKETQEKRMQRMLDRDGITVSVDMEISSMNAPMRVGTYLLRHLGYEPLLQAAARAGRTIEDKFVKQGLTKKDPFLWDGTLATHRNMPSHLGPTSLFEVALADVGLTPEDLRDPRLDPTSDFTGDSTPQNGPAPDAPGNPNGPNGKEEVISGARKSGANSPFGALPFRTGDTPHVPNRGYFSFRSEDVKALNWSSHGSVVRAGLKLGSLLTQHSVYRYADGKHLPDPNKLRSLWGSPELFVELLQGGTLQHAAQLLSDVNITVATPDEREEIERVFGSVETFKRFAVPLDPHDMAEEYFLTVASAAMRRSSAAKTKFALSKLASEYVPTVKLLPTSRQGPKTLQLLQKAGEMQWELRELDSPADLKRHVLELFTKREPPLLRSVQRSLILGRSRRQSAKPPDVHDWSLFLGVEPVSLLEQFREYGNAAGMNYVLGALTRRSWQDEFVDRFVRIEERKDRIQAAIDRGLTGELTPDEVRPEWVPRAVPVTDHSTPELQIDRSAEVDKPDAGVLVLERSVAEDVQ